MDFYSALWITMAWCFSTRASVNTVYWVRTNVFPAVYGLNAPRQPNHSQGMNITGSTPPYVWHLTYVNCRKNVV